MAKAWAETKARRIFLPHAQPGARRPARLRVEAGKAQLQDASANGSSEHHLSAKPLD